MMSSNMKNLEYEGQVTIVVGRGGIREHQGCFFGKVAGCTKYGKLAVQSSGISCTIIRKG